jgi:hypothetical protein
MARKSKSETFKIKKVTDKLDTHVSRRVDDVAYEIIDDVIGPYFNYPAIWANISLAQLGDYTTAKSKKNHEKQIEELTSLIEKKYDLKPGRLKLVSKYPLALIAYEIIRTKAYYRHLDKTEEADTKAEYREYNKLGT